MADAVEFSTFPVQVCLCEHDGEIYIEHFFQRADDTAIATIVSLDQPPFYGDDDEANDAYKPTAEELLGEAAPLLNIEILFNTDEYEDDFIG